MYENVGKFHLFPLIFQFPTPDSRYNEVKGNYRAPSFLLPLFWSFSLIKDELFIREMREL